MLSFTDEHERLDWHTCHKIIIGICEGIRYIHEELEVSMYYLYLKPENILIDEKMVMKVIKSSVPVVYDEKRIMCITSRLGG
jgi:serine/threonine protein kinase